MKLLIVKLSSLGDLFHALPAVHNIKHKTGAEIHWVVNTAYAALVECFQPVDRVIPFDRQHPLASLPKLARTLRHECYDAVLDMQGLLKSAVVARLARAPKTLGPSFHREGSHLLYSAVTGPRNKQRHAVDENMEFVDSLGLERMPINFPIRLPDRDPGGSLPRIAMLPLSRWPTKNWPATNFARVAHRLRDLINPSFYLLGDKESRDACAVIERALDGQVFNWAGTHALVETAARLKEMDLLIANDSGPVHLAAALGVPTLVIFGSTVPERTGPYGAEHRILTARLPCQPCRSRICTSRDLACLHAVTPDQVTRAALAMLSSHEP